MATTFRLGGTNAKKAKTAPEVFFHHHVWFQGDDGALWGAHAAETTTAFTNPQGTDDAPTKTLSIPMPSVDGHLYFQGVGDKLIKMQANFPYLYANLAGATCKAPPSAPGDGYVYFKDENGKLARVKTNAVKSSEIERFDATIDFAPALPAEEGNGYVYFAGGGDHHLKRADIATKKIADFGTHTILDTPYIGDNNKLYFVDDKHDAYEMDLLDSSKATKLFGSCATTPRVSELGDDGNVYWQANTTNTLYMAPRSKPTDKKGVNGNGTIASPDVLGDGRIVFLGGDTYVYVTTIPAA
jgi:hypothetical protein